MAERTEIAWCDSTFNPWIGCTKVSPGCAHCYAERDFDLRKHVAKWGAGQPRHRTSEEYWRQPLKWERAAAEDQNDFELHSMAHGGHPHYAQPRRPRVFCGSLCDWLDDEVPIEWLADLLDLLRRTPHLDWLLLTKRPQNWRKRIESIKTENVDLAAWLLGWLLGDGQFHGGRFDGLESSGAPSNVWIGWTVENQKAANERMPHGIGIPARVRFLSVEPMLEMIDLLGSIWGNPLVTEKMILPFTKDAGNSISVVSLLPGIDWVICGGESGPHARPMHPNWARSLRDQCAEVGVPFFFKQWGEWKPIGQMADGESDLYADSSRHGRPAPRDEGDKRPPPKNVASTVLQLDGSQRWDFPSGAMTCFRVGKQAAGRLLDDQQHDGFPEARS